MSSPIRFGIDLGTTNSALAVLDGTEPTIIKNQDADITPSVVWIDRRGQVRVGRSAHEKLNIPQHAHDTQAEFKRLMGQDVRLSFRSSGKSLTPEELSAEVLKDLRSAAQEHGIQIAEAVITIPAIFEVSQRAATEHAAMLAGFKDIALLQEPIAAGLACGFQTDADKAIWLVFDLGGGTFDAALLSITEGVLTVIDHDGDNALGGKNLDQLLVDEVFAPTLAAEYALADCHRGNPEYSGLLSRLKCEAERIRIQLSRRESAAGDPIDLVLPDGQQLDFEPVLERTRFEEVSRPLFQRALDITARLLEKNRLRAGDVGRTVLVGGPTRTPLVRRMLGDAGLSPETSIDPMTIVARGAAVFAGSQKRRSRPVATGDVPAGACNIAFEFSPVSHDTDPIVGGRVTLPDSGAPTGWTVAIARGDGGWQSGSIPIGRNGVFMTNVRLRERQQNEFQVSLYDGEGTRQSVVDDHLTIIHGVSVEDAPLPNTIRLAKADNTTIVLLQKGTDMPATSKPAVVRTTKALRPGGKDDLLRIPLVEGDHELADRNMYGGEMRVAGDQIRRELPAGSEVELTLEVNASGVPRLSAYVGALDQYFDTHELPRTRFEPPEVLERRLEASLAKLDSLEEEAERAGDSGLPDQLERLRHSADSGAIHQHIRAVRGGDPDASTSARNELVELTRKIDELEGVIAWPALRAEFGEVLAITRRTVQEYGDENARARLALLEDEAAQSLDSHDTETLRARIAEIQQLRYGLLASQPGFWVACFGSAADGSAVFTDPQRAQRLVEEGQQAIQRQDTYSLQSIVRELWELMTADEAERVRQLAAIESHVK